MSVTPGQRLGPYEVVAPLGAGGMGEVYQARDTRLGRTVALKVLARDLAGRPELRERFEREARAISALSHPHICALYDVGHQDGVDFLVMELLEGETIAARLRRGPLPLGDVLRHGVEIAGALEKAHQHGIVHRDLKPGNVVLTRTGAKLLDFGLAKLRESSGLRPAATSTELTTLETPLTGEGSLLGTVEYMAPEQVEGREADARADIWALGVSLYEMATGRRPFQAASQAAVLSAILRDDPPLMSTVRPNLPSSLERIVGACLARDPSDRWQSAGDVAKQLRWVGQEATETRHSLVPRAGRRERWAWGAFAVAALAAVLLGSLHMRSGGHPPSAVFQSSILPPPEARFDFFLSPPALSPDGRRIAFVAQLRGDVRRLWLRQFEGGSAQPLAGTEDAYSPFWSADGRFLAFFSGGKLRKIDVLGGTAPQTVAEEALGRGGGAWSRDGVILFVPARGAAIHRVAAAGGTPEPATRIDPGRTEFHGWPVFLPDGRRFLFAAAMAGAARPEERQGIFVASLDSPERKLLMYGRGNVAFAPSRPGASHGHLLFWRDGALLAQPFDAVRAQLTGVAVRVAEHVELIGAGGNATFSVSETGVLAFRASAGGDLSRLLWFDRGGREVGSIGDAADYAHPRLSPDGRHLAIAIADKETQLSDIWVRDLERGVVTRVTFGPAVNIAPTWSPDGAWIAFASNRNGFHGIYRKAASGAGTDELLLPAQALSRFPCDWSAAGLIAFNGRDIPAQGQDVSVLDVTTRGVRPVIASPFGEASPRFSPDGRWIAYASDESGRSEVYVQGFPATTGKWQVSAAGGASPSWRRDGKELFYLAPDNALMAVDLTTVPSFAAGIPRRLFATRIKRSDLIVQYDVSADGQRFLINTTADDAAAEPLTILQNWSAAAK